MSLKNHQGFTLMESLLVLLGMGVFLLVPLLSIKSWKEQTEVELTLNKIERNIQRTHQSAIVEGIRTEIYVKETPQQIDFGFTHHGNYVYETLDIKKPLVIKDDKVIGFLAKSGNLKKIETIAIEDQLNNRLIHYDFQLGSGKVIRNDTQR